MAATIILIICLCHIVYSSNPTQFSQTLKTGLDLYFLDFNRNQSIDPEKYLPKELIDNKDDIQWFLAANHHYKIHQMSSRAVEISCEGCITGIETVIDLWRKGILNFDAFIPICKIFMKGDVCDGIIKNHEKIAVYLLKNVRGLSGAVACSLFMGGRCGEWESLYSFDIDFSGMEHDVKPEFVKPEPPKDGTKLKKVLHLSDVHIDLSYLPGTDTKCGLPNCCMNYTKKATDPSRKAGKWGAFTCDIPKWTFQNMLDKIKENHKDLEYIMLTGDYVGHDIWRQSREWNLLHAKTVVDMIKQTLPGIPVIPSMGNHEAFPVNAFPSKQVTDENLKIDWLYSGLLDIYGDSIPDEGKDTFLQYGHYTFLKEPGFRIIAINSNYHIGENFYLNFDYENPDDHFHWLYRTLLQAEKNNEKVHILSHCPPSLESSVSGFGKNYARVIDRFANTIAAHFYGHTHHDQFILYYDYAEQKVPINVGFVAPSGTTYIGFNPSYRIYHVDGFSKESSKRVIDMDTYIMDLEHANANPDEEPKYTKLYQATKDLGMANLLPEEYDKLAKRLVKDDALYEKFYSYFWSGSPHPPVGWKKYDVICTMVRSNAIETKKCDEIIGVEN